MKYQTGRCGRIILVRFDHGEDIIEGLTAIARDEGIRAGIFYIIGGVLKGDVVVGPEKGELPPKPIWGRIEDGYEVVGLGTIFWEGETPKVHLHGAFGKAERVSVGCLRKDSATFLVLEAVIMEIEGVDAVRELDSVSGLSLLRL